MFFKNKETGLVWEVLDTDQINRCKNDSLYEVVAEEKQKEEKNKNKKASNKG